MYVYLRLCMTGYGLMQKLHWNEILACCSILPDVYLLTTCKAQNPTVGNPQVQCLFPWVWVTLTLSPPTPVPTTPIFYVTIEDNMVAWNVIRSDKQGIIYREMLELSNWIVSLKLLHIFAGCCSLNPIWKALPSFFDLFNHLYNQFFETVWEN